MNPGGLLDTISLQVYRTNVQVIRVQAESKRLITCSELLRCDKATLFLFHVNEGRQLNVNQKARRHWFIVAFIGKTNVTQILLFHHSGEVLLNNNCWMFGVVRKSMNLKKTFLNL